MRRLGWRIKAWFGRWHWTIKSWIARVIYVFRYLPLVAGFRSGTEFSICFVPTVLVGFYGILAQEVMLVIYAGCWFFGGYIFFALLDNARRYLTERRKR